MLNSNRTPHTDLHHILAREQEPSAGNVSTDPHIRNGQLRQYQFAYEDFRVLDTVIMGHETMWRVMQERERLYALPDLSEDGYVADFC